MNFITSQEGTKKQNSPTYKTNKGKIQRIRSSPRGLSQHLGLPTDRFYVPTLPHTQLLLCILLLHQYYIRNPQMNYMSSNHIFQAYIYTTKCSLRSSNLYNPVSFSFTKCFYKILLVFKQYYYIVFQVIVQRYYKIKN